MTPGSAVGRARWRLAGAAASALVLVAMTPLGRAAGLAATGVRFVDDGPVQIADTPNVTARVTVQNPSRTHAVRVRLHVLRLPGSTLRVGGRATRTLRPAEAAGFQLVVGPSPEPGEGVLAATGSDGSLVRLPVRVGFPYPDELSLSGVDPGPFGALLGRSVEVRPARLPVARGPTGARLLGQVTASGGRRAEVKRDHDQVWAEGVAGAGRYTGTVDLTPAAGGGLANVTVTVRDWALNPVIALLLVVAALVWVESVRQRREDTDLGDKDAQGQRREPAGGRRRAVTAVLAFLGIAALVATSGLLVLYVPNRTFGSGYDYIGVVVWAAVVAEILLAVRRFRPARAQPVAPPAPVGEAAQQGAPISDP